MKYGGMRWVYIRKILDNWAAEGKVTTKNPSRKHTKGEAPPWLLEGLEKEGGGLNADT